ncbi:MAG TPA: extracellular solute-binding protein [Paenibacillus sp.]|jgi:putative aldouronate transport system substrate-binding protein
MNKGKRIVSIFMAVMMAVVFSGCQSNNDKESSSQPATGTEATTGSEELAQKPLVIKHFYNYDWFNVDWTSSPSGQEIQKQANVKIELSKATSGDNTKLNMMVASGDIPDLITTNKDDPTIDLMIKNGMVLPIPDFIDQYAPEIREQSEPEVFKYYNYKDGKQYFFPSFLVTPYDLQQSDYNTVSGGDGVSAIRSDVYEAIGKPDMSTPDGFFNAVKAAKEKFPKLTGWYFGAFNKDLTFFKAGEFQGYMFPATQFGIHVYDVNADGKLTSGVRNPKFTEFVKFMNKMYTNGLMSSESFVDAQDIKEAKKQKGDTIVFSGIVNDFNETVKTQDNPDAGWVPLPYFPDGNYFKDGSGWTATLVSKKVADPERLAKFISFMTSQTGRELDAYGVKGVHWEMKEIDGKQVPRRTPEFQTLYETDGSKYQKETGLSTYFAFSDDYIHGRMAALTDSEKTDYRKNLESIVKPHKEADIALGLIHPLSTSDEGIIQVKLNELSKTYYPKMVMAKNEAAALDAYNEFLKKAEDTGLAKLEAAWTAKYAEFK